MGEILNDRPGKRRGRPAGAPNKITRDIRVALRDLAQGNADRVQEWLDRVAHDAPAEAMRLWLALLRFVTPTLQAAAIADLTPPKSARARLTRMTDEELIEIINGAKDAKAHQCVGTDEDLQLGYATVPLNSALTEPAPRKGLPDIDILPSAKDDLLR